MKLFYAENLHKLIRFINSDIFLEFINTKQLFYSRKGEDMHFALLFLHTYKLIIFREMVASFIKTTEIRLHWKVVDWSFISDKPICLLAKTGSCRICHGFLQI